MNGTTHTTYIHYVHFSIPAFLNGKKICGGDRTLVGFRNTRVSANMLFSKLFVYVRANYLRVSGTHTLQFEQLLLQCSLHTAVRVLFHSSNEARKPTSARKHTINLTMSVSKTIADNQPRAALRTRGRYILLSRDHPHACRPRGSCSCVNPRK